MGVYRHYGRYFYRLGLLISMPSSKKTRRKWKSRHEKNHNTAQFTDTAASDSNHKPLIPIMKTLFTDVTGTVPVLKRSRIKPNFFANKPELHRYCGFTRH